MKRVSLMGILTALILAVVAVAGAASASAANGFAVSESPPGLEYPATIQGKGVEGSTERFLANGFEKKCAEGTFQAELKAAGVFTAPAPGCGTSLATNSCEVTLRPGAENGSGTFDIGGSKCGTGMVLTFEMGNQACKLRIPPQTGLAAIYEESETNPSTVEWHVSTSVTYYGETEAGFCPVGGPRSMTWEGRWKLSASNQDGEQIDLGFGPLIGIFLDGGSFKADTYPLEYSGTQTSGGVFSWPVGSGSASPSCSSNVFSGELVAATSALPLFAAYSGCTTSIGAAGTFKTTINMNSCHYVYNTAGSLDVACGVGGDSIKITVLNSSGGTKCQLSIGPQTGLKSVSYKNLGSGTGRTVEASSSLEGVAYTVVTGGILGCGIKNGEYKDGKVTNTVEFFGVK